MCYLGVYLVLEHLLSIHKSLGLITELTRGRQEKKKKAKQLCTEASRVALPVVLEGVSSLCPLC